MNKEYKAPVVEFIVLDSVDMITLSGGNISGGVTEGDWYIDGGMLG